jgi:hypothetical protein
MSVVGSIYKAGQPVALVKVDNLLYQVGGVTLTEF